MFNLLYCLQDLCAFNALCSAMFWGSLLLKLSSPIAKAILKRRMGTQTPSSETDSVEKNFIMKEMSQTHCEDNLL